MGDIERFRQRRNERLRKRIKDESDPIAKYRILRAIYRNRFLGSVKTDGDEVKWITVNGAHIPLDEEGAAKAGGELKGKKFSKAKSETSNRESPKKDILKNNSGNKEKPIDNSSENNTIKSTSITEKPGVKKTKVTNFKTENGVMEVTEETKAKLGATGFAKIVKGQITDIETFAGKGAKKPMELAEKFAATYGGSAGDWMHSTGNGRIKFADGTEKNAEIHWFECEGIGQTKWKIKKYTKG